MKANILSASVVSEQTAGRSCLSWNTVGEGVMGEKMVWEKSPSWIQGQPPVGSRSSRYNVILSL